MSTSMTSTWEAKRMNFSSMTSMSAAAASLAWRIVIIGVLATASAVAMADGDGTIVGIVTNSAKLPVARATVTAVKVGGGGIRATVSGSDGVYSFPDLPPGAWSLTSEVDGYPAAVVPSLDVVAN